MSAVSTTDRCGDDGYHTAPDDVTTDTARDASVDHTAVQRRIRAAILWYQRAREGRPSPCRFFPSCSAYALEAVDVHGTRRGGWLTLRRLVRCRPLGPSGYDPVPGRDRVTSPAQKGR